ncbi:MULTISPECIES: zinc dependent phospholipase C family protein [Methanobacterium]|nr:MULTISPECIES: zinc dependent phospholipase C family protein [Methanobacterium]
MVFLLVVPLLISPAAAWSGQTHQTMASQIYNSLPLSVQHNLNLNEMKRGAVAPDNVFKDQTNHLYPKSYPKAVSWLKAGRSAYRSGNYKYASYCFGVASHYIEDTFSAPHCYVGETHNQHVAYEKQSNNMKPSVRYVSGTIRYIMSSGYLQGKKDMKTWLKTRSSSIVRKDLNSGASAAYSMIRNCV